MTKRQTQIVSYVTKFALKHKRLPRLIAVANHFRCTRQNIYDHFSRLGVKYASRDIKPSKTAITKILRLK